MNSQKDGNFQRILTRALQIAGSAYQLDRLLGYHSRGRMTRFALRGQARRTYKEKLIAMFGMTEAERRAAAAQRHRREWQERYNEENINRTAGIARAYSPRSCSTES